ncbi:MAG: glycosyltransferase family 39 protein [Bacteroidetes bacterium]|nr:glycosyltransferase family 39 protein [Bacteroidota bacterium]
MSGPAQTKRYQFNTASGIVAAIATCLVIIDILRIIKVPVTHDEGVTYKDYIIAPWLDIISMHPTSANDHILNSLLSKFFRLLLGDGHFSLRLTSLLSLLAYQYFSYAILKRLFKDQVMIVAGFILLNCNPFLFEFFSLCRGYSLAIALMMCSTWYLLRYMDEGKIALQWYCMAAAMLAVYANYSLLYYYLALIVAVPFIVIRRNTPGRSIFGQLLPCALSALLLFATTVGNLKALHDEGQLYYGGDTGIVHDTFATLFRESLFLDKQSAGGLVAAYIACSFILCAALCILVQFARNKKTATINTGVVLLLLLCIPLLANTAQHYLMGAKYLIDRTALFYYPLLLLLFFCVVAGPGRSLGTVLVAAPALACLLLFITHVNLERSRGWPDDAVALLLMNKMLREQKSGSAKIKLRSTWLLQPSFQYYITTRYSDHFEPVIYTHDPINGDTSFDFYYIHEGEAEAQRLSPVYRVDTVVNAGRFILLRK